jgi:flagellar biosynthesis anti-sigma factor FlgM
MNVDRIDGGRKQQSVRGPEVTSERVNLRENKPAAAVRSESQDSVTLSDRAKELQAAQKAVRAASDVREDKVADLKRRIAEGTYQVPAETLARDILRGG